jgi:hypothetical protein
MFQKTLILDPTAVLREQFANAKGLVFQEISMLSPPLSKNGSQNRGFLVQVGMAKLLEPIKLVQPAVSEFQPSHEQLQARS